MFTFMQKKKPKQDQMELIANKRILWDLEQMPFRLMDIVLSLCFLLIPSFLFLYVFFLFLQSHPFEHSMCKTFSKDLILRTNHRSYSIEVFSSGADTSTFHNQKM